MTRRTGRGRARGPESSFAELCGPREYRRPAGAYNIRMHAPLAPRCRLCGARALLSVAATVPLLLSLTATAGPFTDPFGTRVGIAPRTPGLEDPTGRDCALPSGALTLAGAIDLALCRNPATRASWAGARQQAASLGIAESAWVPSVTASGAENWSDNPRGLGSGGAAGDGGMQRSSDAALSLSWTLFDFGGREARIASARHLLEAAASSAGSVAQQTVLATVQAFYGVVAAEAGLAAAQSAEQAAQRSLDVARGRRDAGVATRADVLQAETAYGQAVLARVQADGALAAGRGSLAVTIGAPADLPLHLDAAAVPESVPALTAKVAELMAEAARQRPDLAAAVAQRDAAQADVTSARATGRPSISVGASRNYVQTPGLPGENYNAIGINLTWPLFNGFNTTYRVRQAEAALAARDASAEQVRLGVSLDVWNGYAGLDSAGQQLRATATLLGSATENEQVALGRYQAGVGTIVDVLTAQSALASARQQRITAERGWQVARAQLALALGRLTSAEPLATAGSAP
jgi:outer membrane protein